MATVPFVKQQDFCLRLGLLRALLVVLPSHDRSVDREPILEKLRSLLFVPLHTSPQLEDAATKVLGERPRPPGRSTSSAKQATVADGLLLTSGSSSWGQPVDAVHVAKILEWGHAVGFLGRGNQITERGRLLRSQFDQDGVARFLRKDFSGWNPFTIPIPECVFWLYHLGELDELTLRLALAVGREGEGRELDATQARAMTSRALNALLERVARTASMAEVARLRILRELARTIDEEVRGRNEPAMPARRQPGPRRPGRTPSRAARATTKNADHQAIPRFEMLVDLGFLQKRVAPQLSGYQQWQARNAWSFVVTPAARRFADVVDAKKLDVAAPFQWHGFAGAAAAAYCPRAPASPLQDVVDILLDAYQRVERRAGHTPFESLALVTLVEALERGKVFEIGELHSAFLRAKSSGALEGHVYFAARNEIDRMMIVLKPSAGDRLRELLRGL